MLKKLVIILSLLLLCSCNKKEININEDNKFIEPVKSVFLFDYIEESDKLKLKRANANKDLKNYQIKMFDKEVYPFDLVDINENVINLKDYDKLIFQVVSVECEHCKKEIEEHLDDLLNLDATLVQYFDVGSKEEIIDFYNDLGIIINDSIIIIEHQDELREYIKDVLKMDMYPTIMCYKNGLVTFDTYGEVTGDSVNSLYDIGFINTVKINEDIKQLDRTIDDVKASLSKENLTKLIALDNDNFTTDLTYQIIGKNVNLDTISNRDSKVFINEVDDFSKYKDEDLILIYEYFRDEKDLNKIDFVNELIKENDKYKYIVVLSEGLDTSSKIYKNSNKKFVAPVVSMSSAIPDDFNNHGMANYPSAIFIQKNTFMGAYSNIKSNTLFSEAIELFMGNNSIAYEANN